MGSSFTSSKTRLNSKSELNQMITRLHLEYDLSLIESDVLARDLFDKMNTSDSNHLNDGQLWYTAVSINEPAGKPLRQCSKVRVKLSLFTPEDLDTPAIKDRKKYLVYRLAWQAVDQEAVLTIEDLSLLLHTSHSSIKRYIDEFRKDGLIIPTRGHIHDIGPGISHKAQVVLLFLKGKQVTEIGNRLAHSITSVERYIDDFCVVWMGLQEGYSEQRIARNTKLSERTVKDYSRLITQYSKDTDYKQAFIKLQHRLDYLLKKRGLRVGGTKP